jgi:hypothetical protein
MEETTQTVVVTIASQSNPPAEKMLEIKSAVTNQYTVDCTVVSTYGRETRVLANSDTLSEEALQQIAETATQILNSN